ncbi:MULTISPECIES: J domain-containing protein [Haloferax]|uniref:DnaJ domain-containing protein n=1 Tax=Haloferax marinum TaxID=2666143 RepID=A0A6A8GCL0_9EURY|nr:MULTISPECIES: J domain-containing protein [Haloferax]KAB1198606.1 DnaJ domain-containing protein [Haloferax sp. CBA1150]MRW97716.1 DnaJ domain-containing protein [Haloferax marinum]
MDRDRLVMGLAAVFAGITMLIVVLAFAYQPFLLVMAIPFGATTYFMYAHVSGRLEDRFYQKRVRMGDGRVGFQSSGRAGGRTETGGFGAGPRGDPREGPGAGRFGGNGQTSRRTRYQRVRPPRNGLSRSEALRTLGLDADASSEDVKRAYRERVKETHPDSKTGDEEAFKRVSRAYERLSE